MLAGAAAQGFLLGGGLIIAIGAQNAYVLRQGLRRRHVFAVATVCFLCDVTLIAVGVAGFGGLVAAFPALTAAAAWGGAAFLGWYGLRSFRAALRPGVLSADAAPAASGARAAVSTALALSLLNPHVYLDTVVLIGSVAGQYPEGARAAFGVGAVLASLVWFYGLGYGAAVLTPLFRRPGAWRALDIGIGVIMWAIAAALIRGQLTSAPGP